MTIHVVASFRASGALKLLMHWTLVFFSREKFHDRPSARSETERQIPLVLQADDLKWRGWPLSFLP